MIAAVSPSLPGTGARGDRETAPFVLADMKEATADARKWRARLQALTSAIYKSRSSLSETLTVLEQAVQAKPGPMGNLWSQRLFEQNEQNEEEASASSTGSSPNRFQCSVYKPDEISVLRELCETRYGYPNTICKPTEQEERVIQGLVEGTILCAKLPDFLKRVCTHQALRLIQNTIRAQVEGGLSCSLIRSSRSTRNFKPTNA